MNPRNQNARKIEPTRTPNERGKQRHSRPAQRRRRDLFPCSKHFTERTTLASMADTAGLKTTSEFELGDESVSDLPTDVQFLIGKRCAGFLAEDYSFTCQLLHRLTDAHISVIEPDQIGSDGNTAVNPLIKFAT